MGLTGLPSAPCYSSTRWGLGHCCSLRELFLCVFVVVVGYLLPLCGGLSSFGWHHHILILAIAKGLDVKKRQLSAAASCRCRSKILRVQRRSRPRTKNGWVLGQSNSSIAFPTRCSASCSSTSMPIKQALSIVS